MKNLKNKILDVYLDIPIFIDATIVFLVWILNKHFNLIDFYVLDIYNQINIFSNIISTNVSLAGFILAALTIIVTFKSNLKVKGIEDSENGMELIFSTHHYDNIVKVFKKSLLELVLCFILIYILWIYVDNFTVNTIYRINISAVLISSLAILRSLLMLFNILSLGKKTKEKR